MNLIGFENEQVLRLDVDTTITRLNQLYRDMKSASTCKSLDQQPPLFNLAYLFADVLDALNLLTFNNLSACIGRVQAAIIWNDVKKP